MVDINSRIKVRMKGKRWFGMKIQGPNQSQINPYQKQINKQTDEKKSSTYKPDQLEISKQAKEMQNKQHPQQVRQAFVYEIKQQVESGEYKVDHQATAKKLLEFYQK